MKPRAFCANCGADILLDEPIRIDDFTMIGDGYPLLYRGQPLPLTRGEMIIAWTILKSYPNHVSDDTLKLRTGSESEWNGTKVLVHRIRRKCTAAGAPDPMETIRGFGYRWKPGGGDAVAQTLATGDRPIAEALHSLYARGPKLPVDSPLG